MFNNCGIIDAVSKYNKGNRRVKVTNVVLHIAKPTDQNWKQFLNVSSNCLNLSNCPGCGRQSGLDNSSSM